MRIITRSTSRGTPGSTPPHASTAAASAKDATNVAKFDPDNDSVDLPKQLNGLLHKNGGQKALIGAERFVLPDFVLSSSLLNDTSSNAEQFVCSLPRNDTTTNAVADLAVVKSIPQWGSTRRATSATSASFWACAVR